ncbi:MAG: hypothetical protein IJ899_06875 [Blautia sp.]|nr:hypothetical protein [Blautia sp.]
MLFGMTYYQVCLYFILYSFLGWSVEVVFHAIKVHRVINRGFFNGPVCPVYGFGVLAVFAVLNTADRALENSETDLNLFVLYLIGVVLATGVELIGGAALDKCFHARWWDYSDKICNFHGYICLQFSLLWGLGIVAVVKLVHPFLTKYVSAGFPPRIGWWFLLGAYILYLADLIVSVLTILKFNRDLKELDEIRKSMRTVSDSMSMVLGEGAFLTEDLMKDSHTAAMLKEKAQGVSVKVSRAGNAAVRMVKVQELVSVFSDKGEPEPDKTIENVKPKQEETEILEKQTPAPVEYKNTLETRVEYEQKKQAFMERSGEKMTEIKEGIGRRKEVLLEKKELLQRKLAGLEETRDAWYARFLGAGHAFARFMLRNHPDLKHMQYPEALTELLARLRGES